MADNSRVTWFQSLASGSDNPRKAGGKLGHRKTVWVIDFSWGRGCYDMLHVDYGRLLICNKPPATVTVATLSHNAINCYEMKTPHLLSTVDLIFLTHNMSTSTNTLMSESLWFSVPFCNFIRKHKKNSWKIRPPEVFGWCGREQRLTSPTGI